MLFPKLKTYVASFESEFPLISDKRRMVLRPLVDYIHQKVKNQQPIDIIVICTHNSRRSHFGQVWLQIGATYFNIPKVTTYSGGTEGTAFNPRAVAALNRIGVQVTTDTPDATNPIYKVMYGENHPAFTTFSTQYSDLANPQQDFAAVMVCTDADEKCPIVFGADGRFPIPFEDPKLFDETDLETAKYDERCRQIGREMFWIMSQVLC